MKTAALQSFRGKLAAGCTHGLWVTLESASITEMAVALGLDWVVIDAEHGHLDWNDILQHVRATVRSDIVALVRLAELNAGLIKRTLDIGADGVVIPWMETADQLSRAVAYAHYPPQGRRGIGAERATAWGRCLAEHVADSDQVLVVPIVESLNGGRNIENLCRVPGVDVFFLGPADYSATAGYPGQWQGPGVAEELLAIKETVRRHGKHCGVMTTGPDDLQQRRTQGFTMLGLGMDAGLLLRGLGDMISAAGREFQLRPDLMPPRATATVPAAIPLRRRPEHLKPDRPEVMNHIAQAPATELAPGVVFQALVGGHNKARNLTTGIVTFQPRGELAYHMHPFAEAITVLSGRLTVEVEGRLYHLHALDNISIPAERHHRAGNTHSERPADVHIAMASHEPTRVLSERGFPVHQMPEDSPGTPGAEQVHRHETTLWYEASPGARFQDHFNRDLGCPEMSGGYGIFQPGARLPCHLHDFDESICIIQGTATCVVEGRRYPLSDNGTALVPRGRCHYFVNESSAAMAMVWVYAGPMPERIVLEDGCCS